MIIEPIKPHALTVRDACDFTGLSRTRLYALIKEDRIESFLVGARRMFLREVLESFVNDAARHSRASERPVS